LKVTKSYKIAVIPGDGTGPEVTVEAVKVLKAAADKFDFKVDLTEFDFGGERYKKTGETLPDSGVEELRKFDTIFLGAIGHPDVAPGILEKGILLKAGPDEIDFVVVRENTGDLYTGTGGFTMKGTPQEVAVQSAVYNRFQVDRCLKYAFEYAKKYGKKGRGKGDKNTVALCGKTNVLTYIYDLWERAFHEMGKAEYPDIEREYYHVDATCMWMVKNPEWFDVIVTGNMFGDIITDLGAMVQGGMGIAAGGNINPEGVSMFEPIGGSAPKYTGKGVINPLAAICAAQMMLATLGEDEAADKMEQAVMYVTANKLKSLQAGRMGYSTSEVGDLVAEKVTE
jgi:3-isopropylmalate dehydrogenase